MVRSRTSTWAGTCKDHLPQGNAGEPGLWADQTSQRLSLLFVQWGSDAPLAGRGEGCRGGHGAQTRPPRPDGSPVQVEGGDLRIVSLVVREIKKVRGRLLLSRLPRENGTKQRGRSLRAPSSGRLVPTHERRLLNFQEFCEPAVNIVIIKNDTSLRLSHVSKAINTSQLFYNVSVSAGLQPVASLTAAGGNGPWWGCTSPQLYH